MTKLLLHTCCAPCVTVPIERLKSEYNITSFFYNPNIHPEAEYRQRLLELKKLLNTLKTKSIIHNYDSDRWFEFVKGLENEPEGGKRCAVCFRMRLEQTALFAKQEGFDVFTTVLSISPHKNATLLNQIGNELAKQHQVQFLEANFKKQNGFKRSIELSKKYNLYRQNYCGCIYSRR
ncbi:MAG: epoxyqueuosine reductase QueH [Bacteroidales bacterium]|nr:epoxyqueuosine reductase QueH [Bacteroidales bacterium]